MNAQIQQNGMEEESSEHSKTEFACPSTRIILLSVIYN